MGAVYPSLVREMGLAPGCQVVGGTTDSIACVGDFGFLMFVCLFVCLFIRLFVCSFVCSFACLSFTGGSQR